MLDTYYVYLQFSDLSSCFIESCLVLLVIEGNGEVIWIIRFDFESFSRVLIRFCYFNSRLICIHGLGFIVICNCPFSSQKPERRVRDVWCWRKLTETAVHDTVIQALFPDVATML